MVVASVVSPFGDSFGDVDVGHWNMEFNKQETILGDVAKTEKEDMYRLD